MSKQPKLVAEVAVHSKTENRNLFQQYRKPNIFLSFYFLMYYLPINLLCLAVTNLQLDIQSTTANNEKLKKE